MPSIPLARDLQRVFSPIYGILEPPETEISEYDSERSECLKDFWSGYDRCSRATISSLDECQFRLEQLATIDVRKANVRQLAEIEDTALRCMAFLRDRRSRDGNENQSLTSTTPKRKELLSLGDCALCRDASLIYWRSRVHMLFHSDEQRTNQRFRLFDKAVSCCLFFFFFARFWDSGSLLRSLHGFWDDLQDGLESGRELLYYSLQAAHTSPGERDCSPECVAASVWSLAQVHAGAAFELLALHTSKDPNLSPRAGEALQSVNNIGVRLLLEQFDSLDFDHRDRLLSLFDVEPVPDGWHDLRYSIFRISRQIVLGRHSVVPAQKAIHFQRALDEIDEVHNERPPDGIGWAWDSFEPPNGIPFKASLSAVEAELHHAVGSLPLTVLDFRPVFRQEMFYFALLIDHENFFPALYKWIFLDRQDLNAYKRQQKGRTLPMFGYVRKKDLGGDPGKIVNCGPGKKKDGHDLGKPIFFMHRNMYFGEHFVLMRYVIERLKSGWRESVGVPEWSFARAFAFWGRNCPEAHADAYTDSGIKPERPRGTYQAGSQAVDHQIFAELADTARHQKKRPYFVVISGDSGYAEVLRELYERHDIGYQCWYFKNQDKKPHFEALAEGHSTTLESMLQMHEFSINDLKAGANEDYKTYVKHCSPPPPRPWPIW
jgi:hypothetical protein